MSISTDYLPNIGDTLELRARLFVERQVDAGPNVRFSFSGWAEGLVADRADSFRQGLSGEIEHRARCGGAAARGVCRSAGRKYRFAGGAVEGRVGRLDEVQPSDVINPLDISRYLFEGRNEARLPVPLVRARWVSSEALTRRGRVGAVVPPRAV